MHTLNEPQWPMIVPLIALSVLAIFSGYLLKDAFIGMGTAFWGSAIPQSRYEIVQEPYTKRSIYAHYIN